MRYVTLSLGQAISPTPEDKRNGWQDGLPRMQEQMTTVLKSHGCDKTGTDVWKWMNTTEKDGITFLNRLRAGEDILPEICQRINQEYGVSIEYQQFLNGFNMISYISENALLRLEEINSFCEENNIVLLTVSHTNIYNDSYIDSQCAAILANGNIVKVRSFDYPGDNPETIGSHARILQEKLNELGFNPDEDEILSGNNAVDPNNSKCPGCPAGVIYEKLEQFYSFDDFKTIVSEHFDLSQGLRPSF